MAIYRLDKIISDTRIALDQNMAGEPLKAVGDVDTLTLDDIIRSKVVDAVKLVHVGAPAYLLDGGHDFGGAVYWKGHGVGWVLLPEDFMRLVVFEMDDWERPVFTAISADDAEYALQASRFKGIRGNPQRPVCAISIRPEGRVLEFYSCKDEEAKVSRAVYIPYPEESRDGGIEICSRCYGAVIYTVAALVLTTYGETEKSTAMNELAKSVLI